MRAVVLLVALTAQALAAPGAVVRVEHRDPSAVPSLGSA
jgi:hypothetical protein